MDWLLCVLMTCGDEDGVGYGGCVDECVGYADHEAEWGGEVVFVGEGVGGGEGGGGGGERDGGGEGEGGGGEVGGWWGGVGVGGHAAGGMGVGGKKGGGKEDMRLRRRCGNVGVDYIKPPTSFLDDTWMKKHSSHGLKRLQDEYSYGRHPAPPNAVYVMPRSLSDYVQAAMQ